MSRDILNIGWKFPCDEVYIVATGPNGNEHYEQVPKDAWVIGVNKAIILRYQVPISIWLCADSTLPKQEWFDDEARWVISENFSLNLSSSPTACFCKGILLETYPDTPYFFIHGYRLRESPVFAPEEGILRSGGSISAQAIQLAYWLGAKRIVLVGVDMEGSTYFDGTKNLNPRLMDDGVSLHCRMCNGLCQWLKVRGTDVVSLSPTALKIPVIGG